MKLVKIFCLFALATLSLAKKEKKKDFRYPVYMNNNYGNNMRLRRQNYEYRHFDNNYIPYYESYRYSGFQGHPWAPFSHNGVYRYAFNNNRYSNPYLY